MTRRIEIYDTTLRDGMQGEGVNISSNLSGSASLVRVLIYSGDGRTRWGTVGVSANIVEASWKALVDSVAYKLTTDGVVPVSDEVDDNLKEAIG